MRIRGSSEDSKITITGVEEASSSLKVLSTPLVEVGYLNFELESFLIDGSISPDSRLTVTGTFAVTGLEGSGTLEFSVGAGVGWTLALNADGTLKVDPKQVAEWVGADQRLFNDAPSEIMDFKAFGLKSLILELDPNEAGYGTARLAFAANTAVTLIEGVSLSEVVVSVDTLLPFTLDGVSLIVEGKFELGGPDGLPLSAVLTPDIGGRRATINFSTPNAFSLQRMLKLPGGFPLDDLGLPARVSDINVRLIQLGFDLDLNAPKKLSAIRLDVATENFSWDLVEDVLKLSNPRFSLTLSSPLEGSRSRVTARLAGVVTVLGTISAPFEMARVEGRWIFTAAVSDDVPIMVLAEKLRLESPTPTQLQQTRLTRLFVHYATGGRNGPGEMSLRATVAQLARFQLGAVNIDLKSLSVDLLTTKQNGKRETSLTLRATLQADEFKPAQSTLSFTYDKVKGGKREWRILIEAFGLRGEYPQRGGAPARRDFPRAHDIRRHHAQGPRIS